jgi:hypothetical protein
MEAILNVSYATVSLTIRRSQFRELYRLHPAWSGKGMAPKLYTEECLAFVREKVTSQGGDVYIWSIFDLATEFNANEPAVRHVIRHSPYRTDFRLAGSKGAGRRGRLYSEPCKSFVAKRLHDQRHFQSHGTTEPRSSRRWSVAELAVDLGVQSAAVISQVAKGPFQNRFKVDEETGEKTYSENCRRYLIRSLCYWTIAEMASDAGVTRERVGQIVRESEFRHDYRIFPVKGVSTPPKRYSFDCRAYVLKRTEDARACPPMDWDERTILSHAELELGIRKSWIVSTIMADPENLGFVDRRRLGTGDYAPTIATSSLPQLKEMVPDFAPQPGWANRSDIRDITGWSYGVIDKFLDAGGSTPRPLRIRGTDNVYSYYLASELHLPRRYIPDTEEGWKVAAEVARDLQSSGLPCSKYTVRRRMQVAHLAAESKEMRDPRGHILWHLSPAGQESLRLELEAKAAEAA